MPLLQVAPSVVRHCGGLVQIELPPPHVPLLQVSPAVQPSPSLQLTPSGPAPVVQTLLRQVASWQGSVGWVQESGPQRTVPPQPSGIVPQFVPTGQVVRAVQPHSPSTPSPPQVWGGVQLPASQAHVPSAWQT